MVSLTATPSDTTPASLQSLIQQIETHGVATAADAKRLLEQVDVSPGDLAPWVDFAHPVEDSYGRKLVTRGPEWELMVMSWVPGDFSAIHDHGGTQWGAVRYFGHAEHAIYDWTGGVLRTLERVTMRPGDVNAVDNALIHQMGNATDRPFLSLHLYGTTAACANVTGDARLFDLYERAIQFTDGGVFYCLPEDQITRRQPGLVADEATLIEHHRQMLARIERILEQRSPIRELAIRAAGLRRELAKFVA